MKILTITIKPIYDGGEYTVSIQLNEEEPGGSGENIFRWMMNVHEVRFK